MSAELPQIDVQFVGITGAGIDPQTNTFFLGFSMKLLLKLHLISDEVNGGSAELSQITPNDCGTKLIHVRLPLLQASGMSHRDALAVHLL
jgi:hypothetical protein